MNKGENTSVKMGSVEKDVAESKPLVMIIDDDRFNLSYLGDLIVSMGYDSITVQKSVEVMPTLAKIKPDIILLDVIMPDIDGYDLCKMIKANSETSEIPVLFITSLSETSQIVKGFDVGGIDYVTKPFRPDELSARVKTHIELRRSKLSIYEKNEQLNKAYLQIESKNKELQKMMKWFEDVSNKDYLTNIYNRRFMINLLNKEKSRCLRHNLSYSLLICDIDKFKYVNDSYGHDFGDLVLVQFAKLMESQVRGEDTISRWGGEEFLVLLPETSSDKAMIIAERIRLAAENVTFDNGNFTHKATISVGIAEGNGDEEIDHVIKKADIALYECKKTGRNKSLVWTPHLDKGNNLSGVVSEDWIGKPKILNK